MAAFPVGNLDFICEGSEVPRGGGSGSRRLGMTVPVAVRRHMGSVPGWNLPVCGQSAYGGSCSVRDRGREFSAGIGLTDKSSVAGLLLAAMLMGVANTSAKPVEIGVTKGNDSPALMAAAMAHMKQSIPRGSLILVDFQSSMPMTYYLCGPNKIIPSGTFQGEYFRFKLQRLLRHFAIYLEVDRGKLSVCSSSKWREPPVYKNPETRSGCFNRDGERIWARNCQSKMRSSGA